MEQEDANDQAGSSIDDALGREGNGGLKRTERRPRDLGVHGLEEHERSGEIASGPECFEGSRQRRERYLRSNERDGGFPLV